MKIFDATIKPIKDLWEKVKPYKGIPCHEVIPCKYVWKGIAPSEPGSAKISGPIDEIKENYSRITGINANYKNGNEDISISQIQGLSVWVSSDGSISCNVSEKYVNCPIDIIISYIKDA